jgi:hypothetical protein
MWRCALRILSSAFTYLANHFHHMAILTKAGVVEAKKIGLWVWYRRNEAVLRGLGRSLRKSL